MFLMVIGTLNVEPISESFPFIIFIIKLKKLYLSGKAREQPYLYMNLHYLFFSISTDYLILFRIIQ